MFFRLEFATVAFALQIARTKGHDVLNNAALIGVAVLMGLAAGNDTCAQELPLEVYGRPASVAAMAVSPDGSRVAFRRTDESMDAVFIVDRETNEILGAIDGSETKVRRLSFLDQDRLVLFASESQQVNFRYTSRKGKVSASFVFDVRTNKLVKLLEKSRRLWPYQPAVGRIIGYDPTHDVLYMPVYIGEINGPPATYGVMEVTLDNPAGRILVQGRSDSTDWLVDIDGTVVAEEEVTDKTRRIWDWRDGKRKLVYESGPDNVSYSVVGLADRSDSIIVSARSGDSEYRSYYEMNLDDGSVGPPIFERDDSSVEYPIVDIHRRVLGVQYSGFFPRYEFFDEELTNRVRAIQSSLKSTAAYLVDWTPDFRYLIFKITGGWTSGAYVIVGPDSLKPQMLAATRNSIPGAAVVPTTVTSYEARDGLRIPALVTVRDDISLAGKAPLIVLPHGGPSSYDRYDFDWLTQYFASRGIVVLQPQFRGSTGFGASLRQAGYGEWGGAMLTDLDDGVQSLVEDGLVDPERACVVGASYGGYAALGVGAFSSFDYKCLVAIAGVSDLPRLQDTRREKYGSDYLYAEDWIGEGRSLKSVSPVDHAKNFRAPVLLVHGRDDAVVPYDQSLRMEKALKRAKKQVELVQLKGEDHYLSGYETRLKALRIIAEFIDENL